MKKKETAPAPLRAPERVGSYLKKEKRILTATAICGLVCNGALFLGPRLQGRLLDTLVQGAPVAAVWRAALAFVLTIALIQVFRAGKRWFVRLFANHTTVTMRRALYRSVLYRGEGGASAGDLMNRAVGDVDLCVEGMRKVVTEIFDTGVLLISYVAAMAVMDAGLTLACCAFLPVAVLAAEGMKRAVVRWNRAFRAQSSRVAESARDAAENAALYRISGAEERNAVAYDLALADLARKGARASVPETALQPLYNGVAMIGVAAVFLLGGKSVAAGVWSVGDFSAYLTMFAAVALKASKVAKLFHSYQKAKGSWQRLQPLMQFVPPKSAPAAAAVAADTLTAEHLCVSFGARRVLRDVSFTAKRGQIFGVTAPVAGGKTTLGLALQGALPYGGSIRLSGRELSELTPEEKSRSISYLGHAPELMDGTIRDNITLGEGGDIDAVLREVCLADEVAAMPGGADTPIGSGGVRLSGGQQARLALARALYRNAPVLILDDPFSAVDAQTESRIFEMLRSRENGRIILVLSHRLRMFPACDAVLLLSDGDGVCAPHDALMGRSALYRRVYTLQEGGAVQ